MKRSHHLSRLALLPSRRRRCAALIVACIACLLNSPPPALGQSETEAQAPSMAVTKVPRSDHRASSTTSGLNPRDVLQSWSIPIAALALAGLGVTSLIQQRRRRATAPGSPPLQVVHQTRLGPRHSLYIVRLGNRTLLVGAGAQGAPTLLTECESSVELLDTTTTPGLGRAL